MYMSLLSLSRKEKRESDHIILFRDKKDWLNSYSAGGLDLNISKTQEGIWQAPNKRESLNPWRRLLRTRRNETAGQPCRALAVPSGQVPHNLLHRRERVFNSF